MSGIVKSLFGSESSGHFSVGPPSETELELYELNRELARMQLQNFKQLQPFQKALLKDALSGIREDRQYDRALDKRISPEERAKLEAEEIRRAKQYGVKQDKLLQMQMKQLKQGGRATPQQLADIRAAADAGIEAGSYDIDRSTQEGLGLISDELANSRGLRMTDTPILREATLLAQEGGRQKESLIRDIRSNEASARLNYPLAVQGLRSQMNLSQQNVLQNAQQFQADLRQRAFQNRMAQTGAATTAGLGLGASPGVGTSLMGTLGALRGGYKQGSSFDMGESLESIAKLSGGIGAAMSAGSGVAALAAFSDSRLKDDYGVVAKTRGGLPLHAFRYKSEPKDAPVRLGVMAQEAERLFPEAVVEDESGFLKVDYSKVA